jgi:hypothetical protein
LKLARDSIAEMPQLLQIPIGLRTHCRGGSNITFIATRESAKAMTLCVELRHLDNVIPIKIRALNFWAGDFLRFCIRHYISLVPQSCALLSSSKTGSRVFSNMLDMPWNHKDLNIFRVKLIAGITFPRSIKQVTDGFNTLSQSLHSIEKLH